MTADEFLNVLEQRKLVPTEVIATLRQQVQKSIKIISAEAVAKLLVEKKRLTASQMDELLKGAPGPARVADDDFGLAPLDDPFGLAPIDEPAPKKLPGTGGTTAPAAGKSTAAPAKLATSGTQTSTPAGSAKTAAKPQAGAANKTGGAKQAASGISLGAGPLDDMLSDPALADGGLAISGNAASAPRDAAPKSRSS